MSWKVAPVVLVTRDTFRLVASQRDDDLIDLVVERLRKDAMGVPYWETFRKDIIGPVVEVAIPSQDERDTILLSLLFGSLIQGASDLVRNFSAVPLFRKER